MLEKIKSLVKKIFSCKQKHIFLGGKGGSSPGQDGETGKVIGNNGTAGNGGKGGKTIILETK